MFGANCVGKKKQLSNTICGVKKDCIKFPGADQATVKLDVFQYSCFTKVFIVCIYNFTLQLRVFKLIIIINI